MVDIFNMYFYYNKRYAMIAIDEIKVTVKHSALYRAGCEQLHIKKTRRNTHGNDNDTENSGCSSRT